VALRGTDCDFKRREIRVEQAAWLRSQEQAEELALPRLFIGKPKGGKGRVVPMTSALDAALQAQPNARPAYYHFSYHLGEHARAFLDKSGQSDPANRTEFSRTWEISCTLPRWTSRVQIPSPAQDKLAKR
jgi:integrase